MPSRDFGQILAAGGLGAVKSIQFVIPTGATATINAVQTDRTIPVVCEQGDNVSNPISNFASTPNWSAAISNATTLTISGSLGSPGSGMVMVKELANKPKSIQTIASASITAGANSTWTNTDTTLGTAVTPATCEIYPSGCLCSGNNVATAARWQILNSTTLRCSAITSYSSANARVVPQLTVVDY